MIEPGLMFNTFEQVACGFFARLDRHIEAMKEAGAPQVHLAGSGPCLFTAFSEEYRAREVQSRLSSQRLECYVAPSVSGSDMDTERGSA
jgi:4-diphosphocytidyl-2-C-methyl-D-erythritol kinase